MNQIDEMNHIEIEKIEKIEEKEEKEESIINLSPKSILEYEENDIYLFGVHIDNNVILTVSSISFLLFVTAEFIGAFASNSLSLLGDAGAMSIDVLTYMGNLYSEYVKKKYGHLDNATRFILEIGIPIFSACALIGVTFWITYDAITVILYPTDSKVNVGFLFGFASANACVDLLCSILFFVRRRDVLKSSHKSDLENNSGKRVVNLNMASALTHVSGDSLRTLSVFIAAVVATTTNYSGSLCDAWASIFVTITIIGVILPLLREIQLHAKKHPYFNQSNAI